MLPVFHTVRKIFTLVPSVRKIEAQNLGTTGNISTDRQCVFPHFDDLLFLIKSFEPHCLPCWLKVLLFHFSGHSSNHLVCHKHLLALKSFPGTFQLRKYCPSSSSIRVLLTVHPCRHPSCGLEKKKITFTQQNEDCDWLILGHLPLIKFKCIPTGKQLRSCCPRRIQQHVISAWLN